MRAESYLVDVISDTEHLWFPCLFAGALVMLAGAWWLHKRWWSQHPSDKVVTGSFWSRGKSRFGSSGSGDTARMSDDLEVGVDQGAW